MTSRTRNIWPPCGADRRARGIAPAEIPSTLVSANRSMRVMIPGDGSRPQHDGAGRRALLPPARRPSPGSLRRAQRRRVFHGPIEELLDPAPGVPQHDVATEEVDLARIDLRFEALA